MKEEAEAWGRGQIKEIDARRSGTLLNDWLACPKCAKAFDASNIEKHHIGTLYESYRCAGCGLMSPTLTAGSLKGWWNKREG